MYKRQFSSHGPGDVRVALAKRFDERPGPAVHARIGGLAPDGGTRLGAALRHVTARLAREPARTRLLLLLSDGKPHDDDAYAGPYGLADVRRAVLEARAQRVGLFCVTVDRTGPAYLPRLFGAAGYTVIRDAAELPERLPRIAHGLTR